MVRFAIYFWRYWRDVVSFGHISVGQSCMKFLTDTYLVANISFLWHWWTMMALFFILSNRAYKKYTFINFSFTWLTVANALKTNTQRLIIWYPVYTTYNNVHTCTNTEPGTHVLTHILIFQKYWSVCCCSTLNCESKCILIFQTTVIH